MQFYKRKVDKYLLLSTLFLVLWGVFHVYTISIGSSWYYFHRQAIWAGSGILLLIFLYFLPADVWPKLAYFAYILAIIFLVLVLITGGRVYGARRWLQLGPVGFQPSEFAKISLIIVLGKLLAHRERVGWKIILLSFVLTLFFSFLIAIQPDLGTALIIFSLWLTILFVSGVPLRKFFILIGGLLGSLPIIYLFLQPYQKMRIISFFSPNKDPLGAGWSSLQSKIAIGSGMLFGKGIGEAAHTRLKYLPQPFTDFIFSSIGEEWGFIGIALVIIAYLIIIIRGAYFALEKGNSFAGLFATGFTALIAIQAFINMGMACGIIPVTGVPLPFISYGGSSSILFLSGVGILLAINRERRHLATTRTGRGV